MSDTRSVLFISPFVVGGKVHCLRDFEPKEVMSKFLDGIDPQYFRYLADTHSSALVGPDKRRAAIALHTAYFHGLEALFSLIFAVLHARYAIPAWIAKCTTGELRKLVVAVNSKQKLPYAEAQLAEYSWKYIAALFNGIPAEHLKEPDGDRVVLEFGKLWSLFAEDYADETKQKAYNSFKHGFRVRAGGMKISFRDPGDAAGIDLGESSSGMSFFMPIDLAVKKAAGVESQIQLQETHINCHPEYAVDALRLISISLTNVVDTTKRILGFKGGSGVLPEGNKWVSSLRSKRQGLQNLAIKSQIDASKLKPLNEQHVQEMLRKNRAKVEIEFARQTGRNRT